MGQYPMLRHAHILLRQRYRIKFEMVAPEPGFSVKKQHLWSYQSQAWIQN